jgi:hypothetical protein
LTGTLQATDDGALDPGTLTIGTQDADGEPSDGFYSCEQFNACVLDIFEDDGDVERSVSDPASSDNFSWVLNDDGMIVLTGLVSTYDADAETPVDEPITVKVKAEDKSGLSNEVTIMLSVNKAPEMSEGAASVVRTLTVGVGNEETGTITGNPASLFTDMEDNTSPVTFDSGNEAIATVTNAGVVTGVARGQTTITAKATSNADGLMQTATIDFSITVE